MNPAWVLVLMAAQPGITPPTAGFVRDAAGAVRRIQGLAGNFFLGPAEEAGVAVAFSGRLRWIQTADGVVLLDEAGRQVCRQASGGAPAVFAFRADSKRALAFLPESHELVLWSLETPAEEAEPFDERRRPKRGGETPPGVQVLRLDPQQLGGEVLAAGFAGAERILLAVRRGQALWWLEAPAAIGRVEREAVLDGVSSPLLIMPDGRLVFASGTELAIRDPSGGETRVPAPAPVAALELMGEHWVHVVVIGAGRASYALDVRAGRAALYRLPEAQP